MEVIYPKGDSRSIDVTVTKPYRCTHPGCDYTGATQKAAKEHTYKVHYKPLLSCGVCEYTTRSDQLLENHLNKHSGATPHSCDQCEKSFRTPIGLHNHKNVTHPTSSSTKFKCCECDYSSTRKQRVVSHLARHSLSAFRCEVCNINYAYPSALEKHRQSAGHRKKVKTQNQTVVFNTRVHVVDVNASTIKKQPASIKCRPGTDEESEDDKPFVEKIHDLSLCELFTLQIEIKKTSAKLYRLSEEERGPWKPVFRCLESCGFKSEDPWELFAHLRRLNMIYTS